MLGVIEALAMEAMAVTPEFFMLFGAAELPKARSRLLTVRKGRRVILIEAQPRSARREPPTRRPTSIGSPG